jgi:hypothetical protein
MTHTIFADASVVYATNVVRNGGFASRPIKKPPAIGGMVRDEGV